MSNSAVLEWCKQVKDVLDNDLAPQDLLSGIDTLYRWSLKFFIKNDFINIIDYLDLLPSDWFNVES